MHCRLVLFVAVLALFASRATPALADDSSDAKVHYQKATAHYAIGEYKEAASEYEAAYKAKQDPALLYNAAQSHRLANDNQKALLLYKNIVKLYPTSKYAAESKDRIEKLEAAIATTQSPPNQPAPVEGVGTSAPPPAVGAPVQPIGQPAPGAPVPAAAPPPSSAPPSAVVTTTATAGPETGTPIYKEWWFWVGAAVVVGGAVALTVALTSSTTPWNNVPDVMGRIR
jgi:hypothetical protein